MMWNKYHELTAKLYLGVLSWWSCQFSKGIFMILYRSCLQSLGIYDKWLRTDFQHKDTPLNIATFNMCIWDTMTRTN